MSNVQHVIGFKAWLLLFLSFLEQDRHVTKCSSDIETIQPAQIMTKCLPSYETKPPSWLVWKDGSNLYHSETCQSEWLTLSFQHLVIGSYYKKGKCKLGLIEVKGHSVCRESLSDAKLTHFLSKKTIRLLKKYGSQNNTTLSPANYAHIQLNHNWLLVLYCREQGNVKSFCWGLTG